MIAALTLLAVVGTPTADLTLELPAEARVRGLEMTLGQIATVTGADATKVASVRALDLGYAPAPGFHRVLDAARLEAMIARAHPDVQLAFAGSPRCRVLAATAQVTPEQAIAAARAALEARFEGQDVELELVGELQALEVPEPRQGIALEAALAAGDHGIGTWSVPVRVLVDGELYRTQFTTWKVSRWQRRQVLARAVRAGEVIGLDALEMRRVRVATGPEASPLDAAAFGHAVALRDLPAGAVVTERDVERQTVLRRGDAVSLEIQRGGVQVRALAVALADGRVGDRVRVRCEETSRELVAVVRSRQLVVLEL